MVEGAGKHDPIPRHIALLVRDYYEAIARFAEKLCFTLIADQHQPEQDKRWTLVAPPAARGNAATLLLPSAALPSTLRISGTLDGLARAAAGG